MSTKCGLLWNTYGGDLEWFRHSIKSYVKFASGWDFAQVRVPARDFDGFVQAVRDAKSSVQVVAYEEWPGKGFLHHSAIQCYGDMVFPEADIIFHIDADCFFAAPCTPRDWLPGGKILLPFVQYSSMLTSPVRPGEELDFMGVNGLKVDFERGQYLWKWATDFALGWDTKIETMQWMPIAHHRDVYKTTRDIIAKRHGSFDGYVRSARNEFPQSFCEFNALGSVAFRHFWDRYRGHDKGEHGGDYPFWGKVFQCWSHGGFDRPFDHHVGLGQETPRQLIERLGI